MLIVGDILTILIVIVSLALGGLIGEWIGIEARLERLGNWLGGKLSGDSEGISRGFVSASLLYCVGAMAIVGSMESGLTGNHQTLYAKSILDGVSSILFASSLGIGVLFSAVSVFVYQGIITISAFLIKPFLLPEVVALAQAFQARILDTGSHSMILELTDAPAAIDRFINLLKPSA